MFMDVSSEMIHSILPLFLTTVLGVSTLSVGMIEGIAEATASITKVFAGAVSDWIRRRKPLVLLGYGLSALTKPLFPLATGVGTVLVARFIDRVGKGIRDAPRDALIADVTPKASHGAAYGLRQSLDTVGAFAGPATALVVMALTHDDFRFVFWIAVFPAVVSVVIILVGVRDPDAAPVTHEHRFPIRGDELRRLPRRYWLVVAFGTVLTLARFSEAFLLLRAESVGLARTYAPVVLIVMNVFYAASAYPFGRIADRARRKVLAGGIVCLIVADVVLATANQVWVLLAGTALWGLHLGATQGLLTAVVAGAAPADLRGTAFGIFNVMTGGALLAASVLAGWLWMEFGPQATFLAGAGFCIAALVGLMRRS
jgi:sugar phosphate permease